MGRRSESAIVPLSAFVTTEHKASAADDVVIFDLVSSTNDNSNATSAAAPAAQQTTKSAMQCAAAYVTDDGDVVFDLENDDGDDGDDEDAKWDVYEARKRGRDDEQQHSAAADVEHRGGAHRVLATMAHNRSDAARQLRGEARESALLGGGGGAHMPTWDVTGIPVDHEWAYERTSEADLHRLLVPEDPDGAVDATFNDAAAEDDGYLVYKKIRRVIAQSNGHEQRDGTGQSSRHVAREMAAYAGDGYDSNAEANSSNDYPDSPSDDDDGSDDEGGRRRGADKHDYGRDVGDAFGWDDGRNAKGFVDHHGDEDEDTERREEAHEDFAPDVVFDEEGNAYW
jgi:hypothetical protein